MSETFSDDGAVEGLRAAITGDVLAPGDAAYDDACEMFNSMVAKRPGAGGPLRESPTTSWRR